MQRDRREEGDQAIRAFLADRDEPCPRCGFNLRNTSSDRCTECGAPLLLRLAGDRRGDRAVWWGLVCIGLGLGGAATIVGTSVIQSVIESMAGRVRWSVDMDPEHAVLAVVALPLFAGVAVAWIHFAPSLRERPRLAVGLSSVALNAFVLFVIVLGLMG
ncbi:MAG: hypothetical protein KDA22_03440 [Phycisphaerales bacterium]|nr:hypothetical protein [Phycisphaerales bacterium]